MVRCVTIHRTGRFPALIFATPLIPGLHHSAISPGKRARNYRVNYRSFYEPTTMNEPVLWIVW